MSSPPQHADDCADLQQSTHTPAVSQCIRINHFFGDKQIDQCSPIKPALESNEENDLPIDIYKEGDVLVASIVSMYRLSTFESGPIIRT
jgi:hypothetical protein